METTSDEKDGLTFPSTQGRVALTTSPMASNLQEEAPWEERKHKVKKEVGILYIHIYSKLQ